MVGKVKKIEADVVIAGAGAGGCTLARELSQQGKRVVLIEQGRHSTAFFGHPLGIASRIEKAPHLFPVRQTEEGHAVVLSRGVGGGTLLYAGSAFLPDVDYWRRAGIELARDVIDEAVRETWCHMPPDEFIGPGTRRIWEAAHAVGLPFEKMARHVDFERCIPGCDRCVFGCDRHAKWTAMTYADEAVQRGATLLTRTRVTDVIVENGAAVGVRAKGRGGALRIEAGATVAACGGVHTASLLKRAGLAEAGAWFTGDPTTFSFGFVAGERGNVREHAMTVGWHDVENGVVFCAMAAPAASWHMQFLQDAPWKYWRRMHRYGQVLSIFEKVSDENVGSCDEQGRIRKTFTGQDRETFAYARDVAEKILRQAGCAPDDVHHTGLILGHPSGTVRVGRLLDANLETPLKNLYCCDTSVFPTAPGRPPVLTLVVLAKRLARRLAEIV